MPDLPDKLRIGHVTYSVEVNAAEVNREEVRLQHSGLAGFSQFGTQRIRLADRSAHGDELGADYKRDTLLHEVLHCCLRVCAVDPDADAKAGVPDVEERAVSAISGALLAALRDNPKLVAYLTAD